MYRRLLPALSLIIFLSCGRSFQPTSLRYTGYSVSGGAITDTGFAGYLKPYRDSMQQLMSEEVGRLSRRLDIKRPVSTLGNFMCDAYLAMAREKFDPGADISVVKFGGIRRPYLEAGPVTRGHVFEVMPFDNLMVLVTMKGSTLEKFLQELAGEGAGVAGFTMSIRDKKASNILINGKPLDVAEEYTLVYTDYNYNNAPVLKDGRLVTTNYLVRDALEDYLRKMKQEGKPVGENLENRLYADK